MLLEENIQITLSQYLARPAARRTKSNEVQAGLPERLAAKLRRHERATMPPAANARDKASNKGA